MRICVKRVCLLSLIAGIRWYEKDNGQSSEYEKEYIKKYKNVCAENLNK